MVSAQINGQIRLYIERPDGQRRQVASGSSYWFGPGGSSDGTYGNTPEKWNVLPLSPVVGGAGYRLVMTFTAGAAATADASDMAMSLPAVVNGNATILGNSAHASGLGDNHFTVTKAAGDDAYVAGNETPMLIYTANPGVSFQIGGGRVFISPENNA